jgi:hypothetical protein
MRLPAVGIEWFPGHWLAYGCIHTNGKLELVRPSRRRITVRARVVEQ